MISLLRYVLLCTVLVMLPRAEAQSFQFPDADPFANQTQFLPVDQAFQFDFRQEGKTLTLTWQIEPDYYLYQHRFIVKSPVQLSEQPQLPAGEAHFDEFFGETIIYRDSVSLTYTLAEASADQEFVISYQGCADAGLCYPPTDKTIYLSAVASDGGTSINFEQLVANSQTSSAPSLFDLNQQPLWLALIIFIGLGIGLAFTPCVLPMYPIISAIIFGQQRQQALPTRRALTLSLSYVQGMAVTYSALGVVVALAGMKYQAMLQHPIVLGILAGIFVLLALSMLGLFTLQLPSSWQQKIYALSQQQKGGAHGSVFIMGALSGLVASPCTTAPLSAILLFIAESGDVVVGASALYALSIGMGIPLLLFGTTGGKLLPRAGAWMNTIKRLFGVVLLGVALIFVERLVNVTLADWLYIGFLAFAGAYLSATSFIDLTRAAARRFSAVVLVIITVLGYSWWPQPSGQHYAFIQVDSVTSITAELREAEVNQQVVMLDLYADWCVACKEFERETFSNPQVQEVFANMRVLQADVTANNPVNNQIWETYQVMGLPTVMFFRAGEELRSARLTGFLDAEDFLAHLERHQISTVTVKKN